MTTTLISVIIDRAVDRDAKSIVDGAVGNWRTNPDLHRPDILVALYRRRPVGAWFISSWEEAEPGRVRFQLAGEAALDLPDEFPRSHGQPVRYHAYPWAG